MFILRVTARKIIFPCLILLLAHLSPAQAGDIALAYIGQQVIPHDAAYKETVVGGLSALDYDRATDRFVAI